MEMNRWKAKKEWYDALDAVHDKKEELQNMIGWAQVEISEKESEAAQAKLEHCQAEIQRVFLLSSFDIFIINIATFFFECLASRS